MIFYDVDTDALSYLVLINILERSGRNGADLPFLTNVINCEGVEKQWEGKITADAFFPLYTGAVCLKIKKVASIKDIYYITLDQLQNKNNWYSCRDHLLSNDNKLLVCK